MNVLDGLEMYVDLKYVVLRVGTRNGCPRFGLCAASWHDNDVTVM